MPPDRTLTDADIAAIVNSIGTSRCACSFSDDEVSAIRDLLNVLKETRSNLLKGIITLVLGGVFVVIALGIKVWAKQ